MITDIDFLRSFIAVAETLSFSKAAARRGRVQSAISAQINKLEVETGQCLLERGRGRPVALSVAGKEFLAYAYRIVRLSEEAVFAVQPKTVRSTLHIGTTETYALTILPAVMARFHALYPHVHVELVCARSRELIPRYKDGGLDVAVVTDLGEKGAFAALITQPIVWVAGPNFRLADHETVPLVFLPFGCDWRARAESALDGVKRSSRLVMTSHSPIGVRALVLANVAISAMPRRSVSSPLQIIGPQAGLPSLGQIRLGCYHDAQNASAEVLSFVEILKDELAD